MKLQSQLDQKLNNNRSSINEFRRKQELSLSLIHDELRDLKHQEYLKIRQQREVNESKKNDFIVSLHNKNIARRQVIKQQEDLSLVVKKEYFENKMKSQRETYEAMIKAEERKKRRKEQRVLELERVETELISNLKNTQAVQQRALEALQTVIVEPIDKLTTQNYLSTFKSNSKIGLLSLTPKRSKSLLQIKRNSISGDLATPKLPSQFVFKKVSVGLPSFKGAVNKSTTELYTSATLSESEQVPIIQSQNDSSKPGNANSATKESNAIEDSISPSSVAYNRNEEAKEQKGIDTRAVLKDEHLLNNQRQGLVDKENLGKRENKDEE